MSDVVRLLWEFADLTLPEIQILRAPQMQPVTQQHFTLFQDGLLCRLQHTYTLTSEGRAALRWVERILATQRPLYAPVLLCTEPVDVITAPPTRRALFDLSQRPGLAWNWLCNTYGYQVIQPLWQADQLMGRPIRSAPQYLCRKGLQSLIPWLESLNVRYTIQTRSE